MKKWKDVEIKIELEVLEREVERFIEIQRRYIGRMLRFGVTFWIFALFMLSPSIIILDAPREMVFILISLLAFAAVVSIFMIAVRIRELAVKIKHLEHTRHKLRAGIRLVKARKGS